MSPPTRVQRQRWHFVEWFTQHGLAEQIAQKFRVRGYRTEVRVPIAGRHEVWRTLHPVAPRIPLAKLKSGAPRLLQAALEAIDSVGPPLPTDSSDFVVVNRNAMARLRTAALALTGAR